MKRLILGLLAILLTVGISGCSSKPGEDELIDSMNSSFVDMKNAGVDLTKYIEFDKFKIIDSYEKNGLYVIDAQPHVEIKKDLDKKTFKKIWAKSQMAGSIIGMLEGAKKYSNGKGNIGIIKQSGMFGVRGVYEGSLQDGDEFWLPKNTYKFRKTDNGWKAID